MVRVHTSCFRADTDRLQTSKDDAQTEQNAWLNDKPRARKLVRKMDLHILPLCAWIYLLNYLDRGNIGNSKVLNEETGDSLLQRTNMTNANYAVAVSLFSVAYALFEVPSNWIMKRYVRPSRWLSTLLFCWGIFTIGFSGVHNFAAVTVLRFFIGVFEAGFFPGIVYLITFWYPVEERSVRIAFVLASATAAGAFGGCIAYGVGHMNGAAGLEGFRWLFIIEGLITVLCVILTFFFLPDYPSRAKWLSDDDKKFVEARIAVKGGGYTNEKSSRREVLETCFSPRMLAHYLAYTTDCVPLGSLTFFTPTIVSGLGYSSIEAQLMTGQYLPPLMPWQPLTKLQYRHGSSATRHVCSSAGAQTISTCADGTSWSLPLWEASAGSPLAFCHPTPTSRATAALCSAHAAHSLAPVH